MLAAWIVSVFAMAFGAALGARGLLDPHWAARLVRLKEDGRGGFAEFRATFGGVFLGLHAAALAFTALYLYAGAGVIGMAAAGATATLAFGWAGAAFGRLVSIWRDKTGTAFNWISVAVETTLAAAIGAPWALWLLVGLS
jgi:hypothetical protein